ncbi:tripartite tricarboxylate transporter TctB family protein [Geodermatophilus sp. DF01-2]|uniref:tripartite tricarboxylate transporter TctB family protein n=1 Tax=Geodermatophilus sp. DF01-2 TaxID=2559610 RepID=UPI0010739E80|nr:tripartite tricarboxylate transporter TctB family protein [Geodermatophilus sp. DF01_2]TFV63159.1 tripartite tricarboxylate transporter TctB family protein [Geodermatophilus sp. DF01_2]
MSSASSGAREQGRSELGVALFLGGLGVLVIVQALLLEESLIARGPVGPRTVPLVVGGLLVVVAAFLAVDVLRGGRGEPEGGEDVDLTGRSDWRTIAMLVAAFVANALLIEPLGWPVSGAILFWGSAFALGSRHPVRDLVIAVVLSVGTWYLFVLVLGIALPVGVLEGIL